jgi:hypothetical protein
LLGRQLDRQEVGAAIELVATAESVEASLAIARTHAAKATDALDGANGLDGDVCRRMRALVEGLVRRSS